MAKQQVRLKVPILFEYGGLKKTLWKAGTILDVTREAKRWIGTKATDEVIGYWITNNERALVEDPKLTNPGSLYETMCLLEECELLSASETT